MISFYLGDNNGETGSNAGSLSFYTTSPNDIYTVEYVHKLVPLLVFC